MHFNFYRLGLLSLCILLLTNCAHSNLAENCLTDMQSLDAQSASASEDTLLIFIYPQSGIVNQGKYFRLPVPAQASITEPATRTTDSCDIN